MDNRENKVVTENMERKEVIEIRETVDFADYTDDVDTEDVAAVDLASEDIELIDYTEISEPMDGFAEEGPEGFPEEEPAEETEEEPAEETEEEPAGEPAEESAEEPAEGSSEPASKPGSAPQTESPAKGDGRVRVISVRFRTAGKVYYFDPGDVAAVKGSHVIVETARGVEYGTVVSPELHVAESKIAQPLRQVIRIASEMDEERERANREKEKDAYAVCKEKIRKHGLEMKLIAAEYTFDNSKLLFYFTADGRVDFRELVKDLAGVFRTRIELRQIGVRDETQRLGGYGSCGRPLCCHTWLAEFIPVSIKMAKEQNLSLNPGKISGVCGRLMCCLKNEADTYEELNRNLPKQGDEVQGKDGLTGLVESVNVLRQTVRILVEVDDEKELHEYGVGEFTILRRRKKGGNKAPAKEAQAQESGSGGKGSKEETSKGDRQGGNRRKDGNRGRNRKKGQGDSEKAQ